MANSSASVSVDGVPEVVHAFDGLERAVASQRTPSAELGDLGQRAALGVVPRLTGELAAAIEALIDDHAASLRVEDDHAAFMEFGTRYVLEHRYMKAGFDAMAEAAPDVYGRWLEDQVHAHDGG